ncbi:cytochrome c oxidase subunit II [Methylobacter sp.]|uniref:cytochrome c oxidase subunit II n=1 Tax=Methylobacter sp. TaxID=2051955 RepID=UPI0012235D25|nr:cytochrome c oxidase subunit II [Methylobacter sp.]TAK60198.1 MAG: cytochrome c oxidase subunit II [Methylobacter sp.]
MNGSKSGFRRGIVSNYPVLVTAPVSAMTDNQIAPLNYFLHSYGPASMPTMYLGWVFVALLVAIFVIISLLLIWAVLRKRSAEDPRSVGREDQGMQWIYIGTGISTCILFALVIYTLITLNAISKPTQAPALTLTVTGYDWWWKVEYENDDPSRRFVTANEIHIPIRQPVLIKLKSADVIHAFWVPVLAGKTQMIPGLTNQQWIEADVEGVYLGQCTQYCGVQHAHMGFEVVAQSEDEFKIWQDGQRRTAATVFAVDVNAGRKIFLDRCAGCHTIRGTEAAGAHAPDLTHLKSRRLIAGGLVTNTPDHLVKWITHAQELKPGARMPSMVLTEAEISALSAFLSTLN